MRYEQTDYTKKYLTDALFRLMKEKRFHEISVTEIAKKAGVGRATFYRYFKEKEEILQHYFQQNSQKFTQREHYRPRCEADYYDIIHSVFTMLKEEREFIRLLQISHMEYLYLNYLNENFSSLSAFQTNNEYLPIAFAGSLYNVSMKWVENDCKEPTEQVTDAMFLAIFGKEALDKLKT